LQKNAVALLMVLLGLIILAFPLLGIVPFSLISGFIVLMVGIGLMLAGIAEMGESAGLGILELALGLIALIIGLGFIFNPALFSWLIGFIVWIVGLLIILAGIGAVVTGSASSRWNGVIAIVIGLIYVIAGTFLANPIVLGTLIGLWLIITGAVMFMARD